MGNFQSYVKSPEANLQNKNCRPGMGDLDGKTLQTAQAIWIWQENNPSTGSWRKKCGVKWSTNTTAVCCLGSWKLKMNLFDQTWKVFRMNHLKVSTLKITFPLLKPPWSNHSWLKGNCTDVPPTFGKFTMLSCGCSLQPTQLYIYILYYIYIYILYYIYIYIVLYIYIYIVLYIYITLCCMVYILISVFTLNISYQ